MLAYYNASGLIGKDHDTPKYVLVAFHSVKFLYSLWWNLNYANINSILNSGIGTAIPLIVKLRTRPLIHLAVEEQI